MVSLVTNLYSNLTLAPDIMFQPFSQKTKHGNSTSFDMNIVHTFT